MMHQELYNTLCQAKIKDSLFLVSKLLLQDLDKNTDVIQDTFIAVCSYIGSFISLSEIRLWLDVINDIIAFIEDEQIVIKNVYILVAKLCLLCDIYIKSPVTKTGSMNIKILRPKIIDMFEMDNFKLSTNGMSKFEGIIPPSDSPSYQLSIQIITGFVYTIKQLESICNTDVDKLSDIANKLRNAFDYIIRKRYTFETKFYESDNDAVWFLWGVISLMFNDNELNNVYQLFIYNYSKKGKCNRVGILWAAAMIMVYLHKKDAARNWHDSEIKAIKKIEEVSLVLYNDIKRELIKNHEIEEQRVEKTSAIDGIDYIASFRPIMQEKRGNIDSTVAQPNTKEVKSIHCKRTYMT
jgi:hypothetical protein